MKTPREIYDDPKSTKNDLRTAIACLTGWPLPDFSATKEASPSLFRQAQEYFLASYQANTGLKYFFSARDGSSLKLVLERLRELLEDKSDSGVYGAFCHLVDNLPEWYRKNQYNLPVIGSKFNDIINQIRQNGKDREHRVSDEYKRHLAASL